MRIEPNCVGNTGRHELHVVEQWLPADNRRSLCPRRSCIRPLAVFLVQSLLWKKYNWYIDSICIRCAFSQYALVKVQCECTQFTFDAHSIQLYVLV